MRDLRPLVVIAPDSFKGSCSAADAAAALARGARQVFGERVRIREIPLADGGEGTLAALTAAWGGETRQVETIDALGRPRRARFGLSERRDGQRGRIAIIEAAEANGLPHVADVPLRPLDADTRGVGRLALAALQAGATTVLLCVGGSATSDGGAGALSALGARVLDRNGNEVPAGARGLSLATRLDLSALDPLARAARWRIAVDVTNPLTGPSGAAAIFSPQKGADAADVTAIDRALTRWAGLLAAHSGGTADDLSDHPGMGAAGGLPAALSAIFAAELVPGAELVAEAAGLDLALAEARLVLTGEGRLDAQSPNGKVLSRILQGTPHNTPVVALVGSLALTAAECREAGLTAAFAIAQGPATLDELTLQTPRLLEQAAAQACALGAAALTDTGPGDSVAAEARFSSATLPLATRRVPRDDR